MLMKKIVTLPAIAAFILAACARTPVVEPATDREKTEAQVILIVCIQNAVPSLDDRISGAEVVAEAAVSQCNSHLQGVVDLYVKGTEMDRKSFERKVRSSTIGSATRLVLSHRAKLNSAP